MSSPVLCYITDRRQLKSAPLALIMREALRAGVDMLQVREKDLPTRELMALVQEAVSAAGEISAVAASRLPNQHDHPTQQGVILSEAKDLRSSSPIRCCVLVNDRLDVALATKADGVHLGGQSMPAIAVRQMTPRPFVIGVSCHSWGEAIAAESAGADYVLFGPIFATPSKLKYGPPLGLDGLRKVASGIRVPVLALGGITKERVRPCLEAGAAGIAGIRIFQDCESVEALVRELRAQA